MLLPELATYLQSASIGLTKATNLFYGVMPESPDACVTLYEYPGLPNDIVMGGTTVLAEWPKVQVVARGESEDQDGPRLVINKIVAEFTKVRETTLSGVQYGAILALQPPFQLAVDENFRFKFACNFQIYKEFSTS